MTTFTAQAVRTESRRRRMLVPLATLLAAVAIAGASGATFSHSTANTVSTYATGSLVTSNSKVDSHIFDLANLKPGDTVIGSVTITNTGTLPAVMSVTEAASNGFVTPSLLRMTVTDDAGTTVHAGTFGALGTKDLGLFAAGEARTYTFSVTLDISAPNAEQNREATASYVWNATQGDVVTVNQG